MIYLSELRIILLLTLSISAFTHPAIAAKINVFIALAPVAYLNHVKSLLVTALAKVHTDTLFEV